MSARNVARRLMAYKDGGEHLGGRITNPDLADNTLEAAKLADNTLTEAKLNQATRTTLARHLRMRVTTAQVNAGHTLLPPLAGKKYRIQDMALIAIGGAASGADTVDILGTLSTSRKLLAAADSALTENALVRAGASSATILAAGASFTANDANTPITIGKTGSNLATSTHIDVLLTYVIEE